MTLSTDLYIVTPTSYRAVFDHALSLLERNGEITVFEETSSYRDRNIPMLMTTPGQGLPAWLMVTYNPEGPIRCWHYEEELEEDEPHIWCEPDAAIVINFDTSYGYRTPHGGGCTDLHHWLVAEMGAWLEEVQGVDDWYWQDEYSGEIHHRFHGLERERIECGSPV